MNLKHKDILIDRRSEHDRRTVNLSVWDNKIERRKRPDRRLSGLDVDMLNVTDAEFMEMFANYIN